MKKCNSFSICICFILIGASFLFGCNATKSCTCCDCPLQFSYNHSDIDSNWTKDSDNDGVLDYYDKEPNTVEFAAVNFNGVTIDSDKDGCFDYEDPQPFSSPVLPIRDCKNELPMCVWEEPIFGRNIDEAWYLPMFFFLPGNKESALDPEDEFEYILSMLKKYPSLFIQIKATIPPNTEVFLARQIAEERGKIILNYFLDHEVPIEQLSIVNYSASGSILLQYEPIANNRVEIHVIKH